jgi:hypothetical protein
MSKQLTCDGCAGPWKGEAYILLVGDDNTAELVCARCADATVGEARAADPEKMVTLVLVKVAVLEVEPW